MNKQSKSSPQTINVKEAIARLKKASAVIVDESYVTFPNLPGNTAEDEAFLIVAEDISGENDTIFTRQNNKSIAVDGHKMTLVDPSGEKFEIALLAPAV